mgnify:CR=1 FL=1
MINKILKDVSNFIYVFGLHTNNNINNLVYLLILIVTIIYENNPIIINELIVFKNNHLNTDFKLILNDPFNLNFYRLNNIEKNILNLLKSDFNEFIEFI